MTEGEKRCGLGSFLPMSCRGRAEAFARRLHNRLRSLGSQESDSASETSWFANNEVPNSVTNLQPRHTSNENGIFMDYGIFETPGSPEEEIVEPDLSKLITNPKDDLHHLNLDECGCIKIKRNSIDSDSSDGPFYDTENVELESSNCVINNHVNGDIHSEIHTDEVELSPLEQFPSDNHQSSECTVSTLSRTISEDDTSLSESTSDESLKTTSGWYLNYKPQKASSRTNNNIYNAIDLESLKHNTSVRNSPEEISNDEDSNESKTESYCSHFNIQQDLTIECPNSCLVNPVVEISTLEIHDTDEKVDEKEQDEKEDEKEDETEEIEKITASLDINGIEEDETEEIEKITASLDINGIEEETKDENLLQVQPIIVPEIENSDDIEIEERIPRVRRCSSLKTGKTPPGTPGRKKMVRFADVLGLDLADVRTFMDEIPKIPISAYDDLSGADLNMSLSDSSLNSSVLDSIYTSSKTVVPLFQQPGGAADFMEKIRKYQVCLENAVLKDSVTLCISGTVRVLNLDFHKSVHIRYSLDSWKSFSDLQASYVEESCDGFSDKFSFTLYVHTLTIGQRLEFAVRFQCKGSQYWDNNAGLNYVFQCLPASTQTSYVPITAPDESNWAGAAFY